MKYLYKKIKSMRQLFKIDESEKKRILEMHENATKRNYLIEQPTTDPLVSKQGGIEISYDHYDQFGNKSTTSQKIVLPGIKDEASLNTFFDGWGGESLCDKMKYLVSGKGLKSADKMESQLESENICNKQNTIASPLHAVVSTALENVAKNINNLEDVKSGKVFGNVMKMDNERFDEMLKEYPNLIEVIQKVAADQASKLA
jgi:hypothetical protein